MELGKKQKILENYRKNVIFSCIFHAHRKNLIWGPKMVPKWTPKSLRIVQSRSQSVKSRSEGPSGRGSGAPREETSFLDEKGE